PSRLAKTRAPVNAFATRSDVSEGSGTSAYGYPQLADVPVFTDVCVTPGFPSPSSSTQVSPAAFQAVGHAPVGFVRRTPAKLVCIGGVKVDPGPSSVAVVVACATGGSALVSANACLKKGLQMSGDVPPQAVVSDVSVDPLLVCLTMDHAYVVSLPPDRIVK